MYHARWMTGELWERKWWECSFEDKHSPGRVGQAFQKCGIFRPSHCTQLSEVTFVILSSTSQDLAQCLAYNRHSVSTYRTSTWTYLPVSQIYPEVLTRNSCVTATQKILKSHEPGFPYTVRCFLHALGSGDREGGDTRWWCGHSQPLSLLPQSPPPRGSVSETQHRAPLCFPPTERWLVSCHLYLRVKPFVSVFAAIKHRMCCWNSAVIMTQTGGKL